MGVMSKNYFLRFSCGDPKVTVKTISGIGVEIRADSMWDTKMIVEAIIEKVRELKESNCPFIG